MKVSVIIPTYNSERTIERTLKSILNQNGINDLFKVEILICDDCSTDRTLEICKKYPVRIIRNEINSGGPNIGRNKGIKEATGDVITFLDHDDEWLPNKTLMQLKEIESGYEFIYGNPVDEVNLYDRMINWNYHGFSGPSVGTIMLINHDIPFFEEEKGKHDFDWRLKLAKTKRNREIPRCAIRHETGLNLHETPEFRRNDYQEFMKYVIGKNGRLKINQSRAKYCYKMGEYKEARKLFLHSKYSLKNIGYYFTSFLPPFARLIVNIFNVYGEKQNKTFAINVPEFKLIGFYSICAIILIIFYMLAFHQL
ncbi:MAG: glycosyltransferase family 2 protein [Atribacterota bacterium]|nr:glycosyltransferase family 2 protein [Atribacterota bacterium]